jgi:tetratricopeptide (TPR) repeat protein
MRTGRICICIFLAATVLLTGALHAQSRKSYNPKGLSLAAPGRSSGTYTFSDYSYGLGNLRSSYKAPGTNLLRSSIYGPATPSLRRRGGGAVGGTLSSTPLQGRPGAIQYTPLGGLTPVTAPRGTSPLMGASGLGEMGMYFATPGVGHGVTLGDRDKPITSFIPDEPSEYRKYMAAGETLFRAGRFTRAFDQFKLANYLVSDDVGALLSMAHAKFAVGSYASGSFYLQAALRYMPELPLVPLRPKGFYGQEARYEADLEKLGKYLERHPDNPDANLLLTYFSWFDQDEELARKSIERADRVAKKTKSKQSLTEAIDIFRRGMDAVRELRSASEPPATTQPGATDSSQEKSEVTGGRG